MKTITKNQYYQLVGLMAAGAKQIALLEAIEEAACEITGEDNNCGHTTDILWGSRELDEGLEILGVTVESAPETPGEPK